MKKTFSYNDGQVAVIADYSLFQNPTPNEWNEDVYGYGVEWKPGSTKVMHDSFELYAQYQPIYINYYLTCYNSDGQESVQLVSYANRVGTRIEVADFPGIEGFKCWHDIYGNIVSVGSYIYMTQTSSLFMSCDFEYELKFDGNGAQGHMDPLSATKHIYIDHSSKNIFVEDAKVMLPTSTFSNDGLFSRSWYIDGNVRGFNELYTLTASTTAYALWQDPTQYTIDLGCQLVNEDYAFQYFMLKIDKFVGHSQKIGRFSKICFIDSLGQEMLFPDNATASSINVDDFGSTDLVDALDGSTETTITFSASKLPCALVFDLKSQAFDISRYSRMQIWTSIDQTSFRANCFRAFQLYVSNNGQNWYLADSYDGDTSYEDASIMYQSQTMYAASEETELNFNGGNVPPTPSSEYTLMDYAKGNGGYINLNYIPTQMTKLQFKMRTSSFTGNVFIGFRDSTDRKDFRFFATNSSNVYFDLSNSRWHLYKANSIQSNRWYDVECSQSGMKIDSVKVGTRVSTGINQIASLPICVFGEASSPIQFDLKHLKIYETNNSINIKARYLQFKIQNYGDTFTQFSELAFFNSSGSQFAFPSTTTYECSITSFGSNSEKPEKAIDGLTSTKTLIRSSSNNFTLTYDLKSNALDLAIYNIFKIYNNNSQQLPYDAEIEYLEYTANSKSYIDTQIIPTSKGKWELDVQVVSTSGMSRFLAACPSGLREPCLAIAVPDNGTSWYAYKYSNNWNDPSMSIDTSIRHIVKYCFQPNLQQIYVDDVLRATSRNTWSTSSITSIKMFSIPNDGYASRKIRIFRCKIYDQNDILVGDFIPVRINNVGYMYDNISNKIFGNAGSGDFVLGTDINASNDNAIYQNRSVKNIEIYAKESGQSQFTLVHSASNIPKQTTNNAVGYSAVLTSNVTDTLKKDIRPAKDKQGRSCLVDVLTGDKFYSANSTDIVCIN